MQNGPTTFSAIKRPADKRSSRQWTLRQAANVPSVTACTTCVQNSTKVATAEIWRPTGLSVPRFPPLTERGRRAKKSWTQQYPRGTTTVRGATYQSFGLNGCGTRPAPCIATIQPGYSPGKALTSSSFAISLRESARSTAARLSSSCPMFLAPTITLVTFAFARTHATATRAAETPCTALPSAAHVRWRRASQAPRRRRPRCLPARVAR